MVEFADGDPARQAYIEGRPEPGLDLVTGRSSRVGAEEIVDDIRIYDSPPFEPNTRIGSGR